MAAAHYHLGAFPPAELDWPQLIPLLGPASAAVARYDGTLAAIPNAAVLLSPLTTQEAVLSSRIEGTQATMGEVLEFEAGQLSWEFDEPSYVRDVGQHEMPAFLATVLARLAPLYRPRHSRTMGETTWHKELPLVLLTELHHHMMAKGGRGVTQINRHIDHPSLDNTH